ncbi:transposase, mutator-like family protein [Leptospira weilii serovar Topaz str. LT2116]|uniref:Transposase, mutator-like family protein n=1 Tax=Leptospira weilii serovar Topaz str. LT2116 TaxID=1088540 RepID=M3GU59_9LEPT|nr:transposase, mutator-like family protein [Leptospira weilii serovar Topaz str. LT2116]
MIEGRIVPWIPILIMDALVVKVRDGNHVMNKAFYLALGINLQGAKEILGIWDLRAHPREQSSGYRS